MGIFSGFEVHSATYERYYCIISLAYSFCVGILDNSSLSKGSSYIYCHILVMLHLISITI